MALQNGEATARKRSRSAKLALVVGAVVFAFGVGEIALRIQEPYFHFVEKYNGIVVLTVHPLWDHWVAPHSSVTFTPLDRIRYPRPYIYATNSLGLREDREFAVPRPADVKRILVLGDSFTEGIYPEETVARVLERRLNELTDDVRYEVVNCGCSSYSPLLYYLRLKHQLATLQPDEVLVNIDLTDVYDDNWRYKSRARFAANGEPIAAGYVPGWRRRALDWANRNLYLARVAYGVYGLNRQRYDIARAHRDLFAYHSTLSVDSEEWKREVGFCLDNVKWIVRFCQERGIRLTIAMYPHRQQLQADTGSQLWNREFEHRVERLSGESNVDFYSAYAGLARAFRSNRNLYYATDMHFTPNGQRVWADLVARYYTARMRERRLAKPVVPARLRRLTGVE